MKDLLTRGRSLALACLWVAASACSLVGCGGGGGGDKNLNDPNKQVDGTGGSSVVNTVAANLRGVVAVGAPLLSATVTVVDGAGVVQATAVTAMADGLYALTLNSLSPTMPLMIQARGVDMSGKPVILHSLVQSLTPNTTQPATVNVTTLTNAVVAVMVGGEPSATFRAAAVSHVALPAVLGNATAFASAHNFIKTAVKANLDDAPATIPALVFTSIDLFSDRLFVANKKGVDAALEGVRVQFGTTGTNNSDPALLLSNKLTAPNTAEVTVNLRITRTELSAFPRTLSTASTTGSTRTATTSTSTIMKYVDGLDAVRVAINGAMTAPYASDASIAAAVSGGKPIFSSTLIQDGYDKLLLGGTLLNYGTSGQQLTSLQIMGCLDDPIVSNRCTNIRVAALIRSDTSPPSASAVFNMVMTYDATAGWVFKGNGHQTAWNIYPATWIGFDSEGTINTSAGLGLQVMITSDVLGTAQIHTPSSGSNVNFAYCNLPAMDAMCVGNSGVTASGDLIQDHVLTLTSTSFPGQTDVFVGARYGISTLTLGYGNENNSQLLTADLPSTSSTDMYPKPDGLAVGNGLSAATVEAGLTITWDIWAAAHPDMRMVEVRTSILSASTPTINKVAIQPIQANQATIPGFSSIPSDGTLRILWLIAQDMQGRRYISKIVAQ